MEWLEVIFILVILLLVFGPSKLPEMARELGKAIHEFRKASSGIIEAVESPSIVGSGENVAKGVGSNDDAILDIARKLNVNIEGKTVEQVTQEILMKIDKKEEASNV